MDTVETRHSALRAKVARARQEFPEVHADDRGFLAALQARVEASEDPDAAVQTLRVNDLFIAYACAAGSEPAVVHLAAVVADLAGELRGKFPRLPETWDDVSQRFMRILLVAEAGRSPKILDYAGTGDLRAWLRVALTRFLLNIASREGRERPEEMPFFEALSDGGSSAEAAYLRSACNAELRASLEVSAAALEPRERALLRFVYADGKTVQEVGAIYGVHGATASRWVQKARERLASLVRDDLTKRLDVSESEAASLLRGALSQIELTLHRLLAG